MPEVGLGLVHQRQFEEGNGKMTCKWLSDAFSAVCGNADCPVCADFCPCVNYVEICRFAEAAEGTGEGGGDGG